MPMQVNKRIIFNLVFAVIAFLQLQPYFIWHNSQIRFICIGILLICGTVLIAARSIRIEKKNLLLIGYGIIIVIYAHYGPLKTIIANLLLATPILLFLLVPTKDKKHIYEYFTIIFALALVPGLVVYLMNLINIEFASTYLEPLNSLKTEAGIYYKQFWGAVAMVNPHAETVGKLYRLCGMFDEPGVVGTITALLLSGRNFKLKKSIINKILFLGGVLSFSLFFYIITFAYFFVSGLIERKYKNLCVFAILLMGFIALNTGVIQNEFVNNVIGKRMVIENGKLQGDNRTTAYFDQKFDRFLDGNLENVIFGMGRGTTHTDKDLEAAASWKKTVIDQGFFGLVLLVSFFYILMRRYNRNRSGLILLMVLIASIYQRPGVFDLAIIVIFIGGQIHLSEKYAQTSLHLQQV